MLRVNNLLQQICATAVGFRGVSWTASKLGLLRPLAFVDDATGLGTLVFSSCLSWGSVPVVGSLPRT